MTDATVAHNLFSITDALHVGLAVVCQLLLHSVASRNLITDTAICTSKHQCQGVGSTDYCVHQVIPQLVMYQPD